jgi:cytochrome c5
VRRDWIIAVLLLSVLGAELLRAADAGSNSKRIAGSAPFLDEVAAQAAGLSAGEVKGTRKLYTTKCMRCHKSYDPNAYTQPQWDAWMVKMRKKARLGSEQQNLLSRYLDAYRASSPALKTNSAESASAPELQP